jgi:hypothetical protein
LTLNLVLASASGLIFCFFALLAVLVSLLSPPSLSAPKPNHQLLFQLFEVTTEWPILIRPWLAAFH